MKYFSPHQLLLPQTVHLGSNVTIKALSQNLIRLGDFTALAENVSLLAAAGISLGKGCQVGPGVVIVDHDHAYQTNMSKIGNRAPITIGDSCWIGANAVILKGVELGNNCVVGAGAVVTRSFPAHSIVVGNPARLMRKELDD